MTTTKPNSPTDPPVPDDAEPSPISNEPSESFETNDEAEQIEQLLEVNAQLREELSLARHELAAASPLLLSFGAQTWRCILNARSIRGMSLKQKSKPWGSKESGMVTWEEEWAVMVDEVMVTPYLPAQEAIAALAEAEERWAEAITPPKKKR